MSKQQMFFRMILASILRRRSRMIVALLSIAIGATILSGLVTIYYDVPRQMGAEFRNYGANMILTPNEETLTSEAVNDAIAEIAASDLVGATPFRYESVRIHEQPVMVAGTDMTSAQTTSPYWSVEGEWPSASGEILVGQNMASDLGLDIGDTVTVSYAPEDDNARSAADAADQADSALAEDAADAATEVLATDSAATQVVEAATEAATDEEVTDEEEIILDNELDFKVTGILSTGGSEEDYVYIPMEDLETLTETAGEIDIVEVSVNTNTEGLNAYMEEINENHPDVNARLVKKVTASETSVLSKLQALVLLVTIVVLALTMICVATTMTAVVAERRKEIGLRKAIGASDRSIIQEFMGEGIVLGGLGGILGSILGFLFAQTVSVQVFSSTITLRPALVPITILVSIAVTALACIFPIRSATSIDPALVLKGE